MNFLSTGNVVNKVQLNTHRSTLIVGKNGEGKSTILDALTFSLFGKPFRDINKNQLINSINKKNCLVEVEFTVSGSKYKVCRGIKPNVFTIECDGIIINKDAALKDYQKVLEQQILNLNYKTFTQVIILGSSSFVPFMQLPANQRREIIEDILDIRVFSFMNVILKERSVETKDKITLIDSKVSAMRIKIEAQKTLINSLLNSKEVALGTLQLKVAENTQDIEEYGVKIEEINKELQDLHHKISNKSEVLSNIDKSKGMRSSISSKMERLTTDMEFFNNNTVCPACSQGIEDGHKHSVVTELSQTLEVHTTNLDKLASVITSLNDNYAIMLEVMDKITDKNIEVSTSNNAITMLNSQNSKLLEEIEETKLNTGDIDVEKATLKSHAENAILLINDKNILSEQRNLEHVASVLLKDTGIKTAIIREYLPVMNKLINKYLTTMDFFVQFELDESFQEIIKSRFRDEFTYASFSEGEKQKIDLALLFSWRQIARMKNSVNTNLLLMDEIFDSSLDSQSTDCLLQLLQTISTDTNVFIISHKSDTLLDKFETTIKFTKKNDFSVIDSAS